MRYLPRHTKRALVGKGNSSLATSNERSLWIVNKSFCIFLVGYLMLELLTFISTQCLLVGFEKHFCQDPKLETLWPRWEASKNKHLKFTCLKTRNVKMTEYHPLSYTNTPELNSKPRGHCDTSHICSPWCRSRSPCRIPRKRDPPGSHQRDMYLRDNKE